MARIVAAGLVGGVLVFFAGAFEHMQLDWVGRTYTRLGDEPGFKAFLKERQLAPGIYSLPGMPENQSAEARRKVFADYKEGPSGYFIIAPTGQDAMGPMQLGGEALTNVGCALIVAFVLAHLSPEVGFGRRWFLVVLLGLFSWLSINASYLLWYHFPWPYVRDELFCALLEWSLGGLAIAAIVRGKRPNATAAHRL